MSKFVYFNADALVHNDFYLKDPQYQHHQWFTALDTLEWPAHVTSRVHKLSVPWGLADTVCEIPAVTHNEYDFAKVIESIAEEFCRTVFKTKRTPYVAWSGGIDSTCVLVSLLKVANADFLSKLVVLCDDASKRENPYFFDRYINKKIKTQDIGSWQIISENVDKIVILDGECGNQCMGMAPVHLHCYLGNWDLLDADWNTVSDLGKILPGSNKFVTDLICASVKHAPVDIKTVYDFIWWANFNFKFDYVLLRKLPVYTRNLNAVETEKFYKHGLYRFFAHPNMQIWSMLSKDLRREKTRLAAKWVPKDYIYQFDRNDFYLASKTEQPSKSPMESGLERQSVVAIDDKWNKYSLTEPGTRKMLGQILQRT